MTEKENLAARRPLIEVCVDSVESAVAAEVGGADRVELCDNLMEGGTTPSAGAMAAARQRLGIKLHVIIRPRGGDFCYSDVEFEVMKRDVEFAKQLGVDGVVIGILLTDGDVDAARTRELIDLARPMSVTFHRAFDMTRDAAQAMEALIELGIDRILTSGQESSAIEGLELVGELVKRSCDRIVIMACGGVNVRNINRIIASCGVRELHVTGFVPRESDMRYRNERVFMGGTLRPPEYLRSVTDAERIAGLTRSVINGHGAAEHNQE
ncbi:MAG: copper homeostasis protein CutC [Pyrinomonadaceae bacterium]